MQYPHYKACIQDAEELFKEHELDTSFMPIKKYNGDFNGKKPIWFLWYQGWSRSPQLIKVCYNALVDRIPEGTELIFLDENNLKNYIEIPEEIVKNINGNFTMLSNLIRTSLLYLYGGMWIDSTYLVLKDMPAEIFEKDFWSIKEEFYSKDDVIINFTYNIIYTKPGNEMILYIYQGLCTYWKYNKVLKHYLLTAGIIYYGYLNNCFPSHYIDDLIIEQPQKYIFYSNYMNQYYSQESFDKLTKDTFLFKTTYKMNIIFEQVKGKQTYWGFLKKKFLNRGIKIDDQRRNENERRKS